MANNHDTAAVADGLLPDCPCAECSAAHAKAEIARLTAENARQAAEIEGLREALDLIASGFSLSPVDIAARALTGGQP